MKRFLVLVFCLLAIACSGTLEKVAHRAVYPFESVNKSFPMDGFTQALLAPWTELRLGQQGEIHAIWSELDPLAPWLIYFHGNGENLEALRQFGMLEAINTLGHNVLVIDYPGLGRSSGAVDQDGLTGAGVLAYDWVAARAVAQINIVGRSLGAAVAAQVAEERAVHSLVLISPWTDLKSLALEMSDLAKKVPDSFWEDHSWNTEGSSPKTDYMLVVHGVEDTIIPYRMGADVAGAQGAGLFAIENLGHNDIFSSGQVFTLLEKILKL